MSQINVLLQNLTSWRKKTNQFKTSPILLRLVSLLQFIWYIWKHTFIFPDLIHNVLGHQWWRKILLMTWLFCTYKTERKPKCFSSDLGCLTYNFWISDEFPFFLFILVRYKCINSIHADSLFITIFGVHVIHQSLILAENCVNDTYSSC